ncbi:MAG: aminotransferase class V-fold PLP-dependent enzyme [Oscillospiraceae bacterium]|nr:aminotransferase class V-fold PLP-dependent enzyme [Oscillospiraceae bacterium]
MIYLDHAATTPVPRAVADAVADALVNGYGNPSSQYPLGESAKKKLESDRATIADALGCKADELIFTSCGTESDNFAISIALRQNRRVGKHIITTAVEHSAVLEPCKRLVQEGYEVTFLKPDRNGNITIEQLAEALREDTALVSMMLVNNETGCIFPVAEAAKLLRERKSQALLHTDAVQAFLKVPFAAATLGADMISLSAHKLGAPKGIGALYLGPRVNKNAVRSLLAGQILYISYYFLTYSITS